MPVPQQFINLLNLSMPTLRRLAKDAGVSVERERGGVPKWDYVTALAALPQQALDELVGEWMYAGQTSLTWLRVGPGEPISLDALRQALRAMHDVDPFEESVRPSEVTDRPRLVDVRVWTEEKVVFTFVVARRVAKVIHNFEPQDVYADEFFLGVLRLNDGIFEVRASHDRAQLLVNTWLVELADRL